MHSCSPDFSVMCGIDGCPSEEEGPTRYGLAGAGERTTANDKANASLVAEVEGSSILIPAVSR